MSPPALPREITWYRPFDNTSRNGRAMRGSYGRACCPETVPSQSSHSSHTWDRCCSARPDPEQRALTNGRLAFRFRLSQLCDVSHPLCVGFLQRTWTCWPGGLGHDEE